VTFLLTITSAEKPISGVDGSLFNGLLLWSLITESGEPTAGVDIVTGHRVVYKRFPVVCINGIFNTNLWPTSRDRDGRTLFYLCEFPNGLTMRVSQLSGWIGPNQNYAENGYFKEDYNFGAYPYYPL
jgi:hypothetical protein